MSRVTDKNDVQLTRGMRVFRISDGERRDGKVIGTLAHPAMALVEWDDDPGNDEYIEARTLTTIDSIHSTRRRR